MTVDKYGEKFQEVGRFAPDVMTYENKKAQRFKEDLRPYIYDKVGMFKLNNFQALMEKAIVIEGLIKSVAPFVNSSKAFVPQKRASPFSSPLDKRPRVTPPQPTRSIPVISKTTSCPHCGKNHGNQLCYRASNASFKCGTTQHKIKECPMLRGQAVPMNQSRVYALIAPDTEATVEVIKGTFISKHPAHVLIDTTATHSFV